MEDKIYTMAGKKIDDLIASPFKTEEELQKLIAEHPKLLAWEQMNPGGSMRWIFVQREMGIAKDAGAGDWWAVDHLFIDQDAVPTLVEVKRGADTRIRREVVGQMLEYAAHASKTWTADSLRQTFEQTSADPEAELGELLGVEDADGDELRRDEFWQKVSDNLAAKRLRLLFVADDVPDELTRIVEFLNAAMEHVEVLAVKIKKYDGESRVRTLVPHVIGRTAKPAATKSQKLNRESFLAAFEVADEHNAAQRLLEVAEQHKSGIWRTSCLVIRCRSPGREKRTSVAWICPPGANAGGVKDFTFGHMSLKDEPPELQKLLRAWAAPFSNDEFAHPVPAKWGTGWRVAASDAALHIDTLAERLDKVLSELRSLPAP